MSEVEQRASFRTWLHTEAGIDNMTASQYTQAELTELQLGWLIREQDADQQRDSHDQTLRRNYQQEVQQMIDDVDRGVA